MTSLNLPPLSVSASHRQTLTTIYHHHQQHSVGPDMAALVKLNGTTYGCEVARLHKLQKLGLIKFKKGCPYTNIITARGFATLSLPPLPNPAKQLELNLAGTHSPPIDLAGDPLPEMPVVGKEGLNLSGLTPRQASACNVLKHAIRLADDALIDEATILLALS